jgi:hypothetical protein
MSSDPDKLRRCTAAPSSDPRLRCEGEVTSNTTHIEDHWATQPDGTRIRWTDRAAVQWQPEVGPSVLNAFASRYPYPAQLGPDVPAPASERQVGGEHYRKFKIQPWDIWEEYELGAFEGAILKYLLRDKGNRLEDLKKARHTLDKLIEIEEGK